MLGRSILVSAKKNNPIGLISYVFCYMYVESWKVIVKKRLNGNIREFAINISNLWFFCRMFKILHHINIMINKGALYNYFLYLKGLGHKETPPPNKNHDWSLLNVKLTLFANILQDISQIITVCTHSKHFRNGGRQVQF